jgi:hypothetical protein
MNRIAVLLAVVMAGSPAFADLIPGAVVSNTASSVATDPPQLNFVPGSGGTFTAYIYPVTVTGALTNDTGFIALPTGITLIPGFQVLLTPGLNPANPGDFANQANWAQVLEFFTNGLELFSAPVAYPSLGTVLSSPHQFFDQSPNGQSIPPNTGVATYVIFSPQAVIAAEAGAAPEPVSAIVLLTMAASALTLLRRPS